MKICFRETLASGTRLRALVSTSMLPPGYFISVNVPFPAVPGQVALTHLGIVRASDSPAEVQAPGRINAMLGRQLYELPHAGRQWAISPADAQIRLRDFVRLAVPLVVRDLRQRMRQGVPPDMPQAGVESLRTRMAA